MDAQYTYIRTKGVSVKAPAIAPYGMKQPNLMDLDGFGICLQWPVG